MPTEWVWPIGLYREAHARWFLLPRPGGALPQNHSRAASAAWLSPEKPLCPVGLFCQEYVHHLLRLERRAEEQFLEHWLNPHCKPHCDRNVVHPV